MSDVAYGTLVSRFVPYEYHFERFYSSYLGIKMLDPVKMSRKLFTGRTVENEEIETCS